MKENINARLLVYNRHKNLIATSIEMIIYFPFNNSERIQAYNQIKEVDYLFKICYDTKNEMKKRAIYLKKYYHAYQQLARFILALSEIMENFHSKPTGITSNHS